MTQLNFIVYTSPAPQGSMKAFVVAGKARMTCDNKKTKPFRQAVTEVVRHELAQRNLPEPWAGKHVPVSLMADFFIRRPQSVSKKRSKPSVRPDLDKLARSLNDSLSGVLWLDDGQVTEIRARKFYATGPEYVAISASVEEQ